MTPDLLRALFPLTARHHAVALARVALHYAWLPYMVAAHLMTTTHEQNPHH